MNMNKKKLLIMVLAVALIAVVTISGTIAWLTDSTVQVENTFTPTTVSVSIEETDATTENGKLVNDYEMVPGHMITKDPSVTVTNDVDVYLFVKVTESTNFDDFMTWTIADGWNLYVPSSAPTDEATIATTDEWIIYREVGANASTKTFGIIANNTVAVKTSVEKADMDGLTAETYPTLTFESYVIQKYSTNNKAFDVADAWAAVSGS